MKKFSAGETVGKGTYWNLRYGGLVDLKSDGVLPGGRDTTYYRIPFALLFLMVPVLGGLYVILLPIIVNVMGVYLLGRRVFGGLLFQARKSVSFGWRPTEAYLAGKNRKKEDREDNGSNDN